MTDFVSFHKSSSVTNCGRLKMPKQMLFRHTLPVKCVPDIRRQLGASADLLYRYQILKLRLPIPFSQFETQKYGQ